MATRITVSRHCLSLGERIEVRVKQCLFRSQSMAWKDFQEFLKELYCFCVCTRHIQHSLQILRLICSYSLNLQNMSNCQEFVLSGRAKYLHDHVHLFVEVNSVEEWLATVEHLSEETADLPHV